MKILVVKLTSMGDAIHVLPALSDLSEHIGDAEIDWMIEESFVDIPAWHPSIKLTIPVATRRWRTLSISNIKDFFSFLHKLRKRKYDVIIDAQGLLKSAVFSRMAKANKGGIRIGFHQNSIKEKIAAKLYNQKIEVARNQHAINKLRQLFALAFDYPVNDEKPDYKISKQSISSQEQTIMFLHGTTWESKHLPEHHWTELVNLANENGFKVLLPWGNAKEKARAERIANKADHARVMPKSTLDEMRASLASVSGAIAVDTGLGHLAAALGVPTVSVYGSTNSELTGAIGDNQLLMQSPYECSPCLLKKCNKLDDQNPSTPPCYTLTASEVIFDHLLRVMEARN